MNSRLLLILDLLVVGYGQYVYEMCFDKNNSLDYMASGFQLNCSLTGQITHVYMLSGMGSCHHQVCYGETISLLVDIHQCYWKSTCQIKWPDRRMEKVEDESNKNCFGQSTDFLHIKTYTCFYPNRQKNKDSLVLCGASNTKIMACSEGIIRSHDIFPWQYDVNKRECSTTLSWLLSADLYVTVQKLDIDQLDSLYFLADGKDIVLNKTGPIKFQSNKSTNVTFKFLIHPDSNAGSGFVLCFKFSKTMLQDQDICNELTTDGEIGQIAITTKTVPTTTLPAVTFPSEKNNTSTSPTNVPTNGCKPKKKGKKCNRTVTSNGKKHFGSTVANKGEKQLGSTIANNGEKQLGSTVASNGKMQLGSTVASNGKKSQKGKNIKKVGKSP